MEEKLNKGFSFYICIGKWSKPEIEISRSMKSVRICIGFIAVRAGFYDIEVYNNTLTELARLGLKTHSGNQQTKENENDN